MRALLRALAWRLVGFRLLPLGPGDVLILTYDRTRCDIERYHTFLTLFDKILSQRGAKLLILSNDFEVNTVLHDRATPIAYRNRPA